MIECVFTIDYEIYGNGEGRLFDLVYEPTRKLIRIFEKAGVRFVCFVEAVELQTIEKNRADPAIRDVRRQIRELYHQGFEIALHCHPQWFNASHRHKQWLLDYSEYNLCVLPKERIVQMLGGAIDYLRDILALPDFTPLAYRAGNWLFQPTRTAACVLVEQGIKIDSSVFKGGVQHNHRLDYRRASRNGPFWTFTDDVNLPDPGGQLLEIPIYAEIVPFWKMVTKKRLGLQKRAFSAGNGVTHKFARIRDFTRLWQPLKFDFCRMALDELISMTDHAIADDKQQPELFRPMVAIGHSKDLVDFRTVESFLAYLERKGIAVSTFKGAYPRCRADAQSREASLFQNELAARIL
jgi:peptidoglycan/xylan/chitin deacetylase (PgdA/CDA1 family)